MGSSWGRFALWVHRSERWRRAGAGCRLSAARSCPTRATMQAHHFVARADAVAEVTRMIELQFDGTAREQRGAMG